MSTEYKVFRDPIYNLILFDKEKDALILKLIDTPEMQRLKRIRQLGVSWFTYPSATHDRFAHSLGVSFIAGKMFDQLWGNNSESVKIFSVSAKKEIPVDRTLLKLLVQTTGLLHDIGHGPFSHAFEQIMKGHKPKISKEDSHVDGKIQEKKFKHEEYSKDIINSELHCVYRTICSYFDENDGLLGEESKEPGKDFTHWIIDLISGTFGGNSSVQWMNDIISSQLDADRIDYLLRDAYMCGVQYAQFDRQWLIRHLSIRSMEGSDEERVVIDAKKGIYTLESFIVSRYHMYEQVYFHKTTRGVEKLLESILKRAKDLHSSDENQDIQKSAPALMDYFDHPENLKAYLKLDDFLAISYIKEWSLTANDPILKDLCVCFVERKLFKRVKETETSLTYDLTEAQKLPRIFDGEGRNKKLTTTLERYFFVQDSYQNIPYKDSYLLGNRSDASNRDLIWLWREKPIELSAVSKVVNSLKNAGMEKSRIYIHRDYFQKYKKAMEENLES